MGSSFNPTITTGTAYTFTWDQKTEEGEQPDRKYQRMHLAQPENGKFDAKLGSSAQVVMMLSHANNTITYEGHKFGLPKLEGVKPQARLIMSHMRNEQGALEVKIKLDQADSRDVWKFTLEGKAQEEQAGIQLERKGVEAKEGVMAIRYQAKEQYGDKFKDVALTAEGYIKYKNGKGPKEGQERAKFNKQASVNFIDYQNKARIRATKTESLEDALYRSTANSLVSAIDMARRKAEAHPDCPPHKAEGGKTISPPERSKFIFEQVFQSDDCKAEREQLIEQRKALYEDLKQADTYEAVVQQLKRASMYFPSGFYRTGFDQEIALLAQLPKPNGFSDEMQNTIKYQALQHLVFRHPHGASISDKGLFEPVLLSDECFLRLITETPDLTEEVFNKDKDDLESRWQELGESGYHKNCRSSALLNNPEFEIPLRIVETFIDYRYDGRPDKPACKQYIEAKGEEWLNQYSGSKAEKSTLKVIGQHYLEALQKAFPEDFQKPEPKEKPGGVGVRFEEND